MAKQSDMSLLFNDVLECCSGLTNLLNSGKRKSSFTCTDAGTPAKQTRIVSIMSVPPSSWEARRLKTDMIAMKAQITKLEARINHQHAIRKKMQILFDKEKASLVDQHKRDERLMSNLEDRLKLLRKREQDLRDKLTQSVKEFKDSKAKWESERLELQRQVAELKDQLLEADVSNKDQLSEMEKDMNELLAALEGAQEESEFLKGEVEKLKEKYDQCTSFKALIQKKAFEMQQATYKLKEIEYERDSYKYWQQQAKTPEERLSNMADLEREVVRIGATDGSLRDAVCKKLILEEQVHILSTKLEALQPVQQELHEAKVKIASLESSLEEWRSTARGHGVETARALSSALENALSGQLNAVAGASQAQSQLARLTEEVAATLKFEGDKATAKLNDLETVRKNQESLIHRLKKRLLLVTRERDIYRQQLDSYEKELTVTLSGDVGAGGAALLSARVEQLEKALQGYRDLLSTHDQEGHSKALEAARAEVSKYREEAEAAKREVSKLRAQRDQLHAHSEKLAAPTKTKKLKAALREGGSCPEDMQQLKQQLENRNRIKLQRMKEKFTASAQEYRDFCYMLLGYKIDRIGHKKYRVSNKYSKTPDEYLTVTLCEDGIEMEHTDYSSTLEELVELHLHQHHSIPMFLSALTMDLFTRTTMQGA